MQLNYSDGENTSVSKANKEEYVHLYIDHILNKVIVDSFFCSVLLASAIKA